MSVASGTDQTSVTQTSPDAIDKCVGPDHPMDVYSTGCQTTYSLVQRRHVSLQVQVSNGKSKSCGVQATSSTNTSSSQCLMPIRKKTPTKMNDMESIDSQTDYESAEDLTNCGDSDPDWIQDGDHEDVMENDHNHMDEEDTEPDKARTYVVFEQSLLELLDLCPTCNRRNLHHVKTFIGTCVMVCSSCVCGFSRQWSSQPFSQSMPWGNLIFASAVFFSGNSPVKTFNFMRHAGILGLSLTTYNRLQSTYIVPSTLSCWQFQQSVYMTNIKRNGSSIKLRGDARCSSPGHTAKYGSYTVMDVQTAKMVYVQLVQSNEVENSYNMELEGLKRCLQFLHEEGVQVTDIVTDRHSQVKMFLRTVHPSVNHWFDVWHVAKGVYKKFETLGKSKKYALAGLWARSVSNHVYWCAASSEGNRELVRQKWTSSLNHITDIHEGHGDLLQS